VNPITSIKELKRPFIYYHTHVITKEVLDHAISHHKSIEIDVSVGDDGKPYIGHPLSFYKFKGLPAPNNLALDKVFGRIKESDLFIVFDCKDVRALPAIKEMIHELGNERCLFHTWIDALEFTPYPSDLVVEPHWVFEDLPLAPVLQFFKETSVPMIFSTRGLTHERIASDSESILARIHKAAADTAAAIYCNLPGGEIPSREFVKRLESMNLLAAFNLDKVPPDQRPDSYIAFTDNIELATHPQSF
jgi:hypothetical protein